jgi:hypothetical protein
VPLLPHLFIQEHALRRSDCIQNAQLDSPIALPLIGAEATGGVDLHAAGVQQEIAERTAGGTERDSVQA